MGWVHAKFMPKILSPSARLCYPVVTSRIPLEVPQVKILGWLFLCFGLVIAVMPFFWVASGTFMFVGALLLIGAAINSRRKIRVEFDEPRSDVNNSMFGR
jgi:hypothetical protein